MVSIVYNDSFNEAITPLHICSHVEVSIVLLGVIVLESKDSSYVGGNTEDIDGIIETGRLQTPLSGLLNISVHIKSSRAQTF